MNGGGGISNESISVVKKLFSGRKTGYSIKGFWGQIKHYNKDGVQIGYTVKWFWGVRRRYDMNGNLVSYSVKNFWGGRNTYEQKGVRKVCSIQWTGY